MDQRHANQAIMNIRCQRTYGRRSENPRMTDERLETIETSENSHGPPATDITNEYVSDVGADFTSISLVT